MDILGKHEMEIISSFKRFSAAFEKIKNYSALPLF